MPSKPPLTLWDVPYGPGNAAAADGCPIHLKRHPPLASTKAAQYLGDSLVAVMQRNIEARAAIELARPGIGTVLAKHEHTVSAAVLNKGCVRLGG